jgi:NifB/MoaA-like Fe-S oxidoreductase
MQNEGVKIESIAPGSPAEEAGFKSGDCLVKIDGHEIEDLLDVLFHLQPEGAEMEVLREGELFDIELVTSPGEGSGWKLEPLEARTCHCNCTFCFIDQLPKGLRAPLYLKDEDYRFSFLFGNYLTLVGLNSHDYDRIFKLRLSPLYVSIHATDAEIRGGLLGIGKASIMPHLKRLIEGGDRSTWTDRYSTGGE